MNPKLMKLLLVMALILASVGTGTAIAKKKKSIDLELHYTGAYADETSPTGYTQSVGVIVDPVIGDNEVTIKYFEEGNSWVLLDTASVAPYPEFGDAWALFTRSESDGVCKLTVKYPGNSKYKTAKLHALIDCETGDVMTR